MSDWGRIRIGIEPEDRPDRAIVTPAEMRQAIDKAKYESALVGNCMRTADYAGFSAEDRYTLLAYNALVALETYYKRCLEMTMLYPQPPLMRPADTEVKRGD